MIFGSFHEGSGLGDQLMRYITVRTLAEEKGFEWAMIGSFKGDFFLNKPENTLGVPGNPNVFLEKEVRENGADVRSYDPEINFVKDNTYVEGSFEDFKYWGHNLTNINEWLKVEPLEVPDEICLIGVRGGEYAAVPELFLPPMYFGEAMQQMPASIKGYEIHTDDPALASSMFKGSIFKIIDNQQLSHSKHSNMAFNWRSARYAKHAIIPNSAFFILPRLLKHHEDPEAVTIAPRWWARRNTKGPWRPAAFYKQFIYV